MKKILFLLLLLGGIFTARAEDYRRSSLCLVLIDETDMPKRDTIVKAFLDVPMPDKFNDHNIADRVFNPEGWTVTKEDRAAYDASYKTAVASGTTKKRGGGFGKFMKIAAAVAISAATGTEPVMIDTKDKDEYAVIANKYLLEQKVAKQLFDQWFLDSLGNFSVDLIKERGLYGASMMDVQTAKSSVRGMGMLEDAGEELIGNTFVVVSRFRYMSKEELMNEIDATAKAVAGAVGGENAQLFTGLATLGTRALVVGSGYYVRSTSFLFKINWNADVADKLYGELWDDRNKYDASDIFSLTYIGQESAFANVKAGIFTNKQEGELIRIATVNATDAVLAKLQRKYEVFRTKTPLVVDGDKFYAHIGMKEGLEAGDRFEVLEAVAGEDGKTKYTRKGVLTVAKDRIWDNRFMANEEMAAQGQEQSLTATEFTGGTGSLYSGMLLRQIR